MISPVLRVVSYADVNDLLISSDSNALMTLELGDDAYGIMPVSGIGTVSNTIGGKLYVVARYVNPSTETYNYIDSWIEPKDNRYEIKFQCPSNCYFYQFGIYLYKDNLPSPGTYNMSFDFSSQISCTYSSSLLSCVTLLDNAKTEFTRIDLSSRIDTFSGDIYISPFSLNITPVDYCELSFNFDSNEEIRLIDGDFAVCFAKTVGDSSAPSTGPDYSSEDYQSDVSSSLSGLSSSVDSMTEDLSSAAESLEYISSSQNLIIQGIDNVIMHISDQLYAFWDQLYNLIHVPTMAKMDEIIEAINNMDLEIEVNLDGLKQSINQMSQSVQNKLQSVQDGINNKLQDTTDHITGGYDNSGMSSDKDRLDSSIQDYDEVEKDLVSDATDNIDEFVFDLDLSEFIGPIQDISYFMQGIFETMGPMNVAVSFSLMLSVALVLIGWYRFKGGA